MKPIRPHYVLLLLILLFSLPGVTAYIFYLNPQWLGTATTNKGAFLEPPLLVSPLGGDSKWRLVLWSPTTCERNCIEHLDKLARVRLALGRRLYDVETSLLLGANAGALSTSLTSMLHDKDIHVVKLSANESERLSMLCNTSNLFIANPDDYLVLSYQITTKSDDIFHDIKLLLKKD